MTDYGPTPQAEASEIGRLLGENARLKVEVSRLKDDLIVELAQVSDLTARNKELEAAFEFNKQELIDKQRYILKLERHLRGYL